MPDAAGCPFCQRIAGHEFDYFDTHSVAFRPLNPVTPGHFLVVPRKHVTHALEGPEHAGRALKFAGYLANQMGLLSANFITSAGSAATQTVMHLHVHVVPRREGDGLALPWTGQQEWRDRAGALGVTGPDGEPYRAWTENDLVSAATPLTVVGVPAVACRHCQRPIVACTDHPGHGGCSSGYGWIHAEPNWGHSCQPRAGAPYAQPEAS